MTTNPASTEETFRRVVAENPAVRSREAHLLLP